MGRMVMQEALKSPNRFELTAAVVRKGSHNHGNDISDSLNNEETGIRFEDHPEVSRIFQSRCCY